VEGPQLLLQWPHTEVSWPLVAFEVALSQTNIIMLSSLCRNSHICLKGLSLLFLPLGLSL
jgi:hypothetical protein